MQVIKVDWQRVGDCRNKENGFLAHRENGNVGSNGLRGKVPELDS